MANERTNKIISALLIFCITMAIVYYRRQTFSKRKQPALMPSFLLIDRFGRRISNGDFVGRTTYVQFVHSLDHNNLDILTKVYSLWRDRGVAFLFITDRIEELIKKDEGLLGPASPSLYICGQSEDVERKFLSKGYGKHFLFDASGRLAYSADNNREYENGVRVSLQRVVLNDVYDISALLDARQNIFEVPEFKFTWNIISTYQKEYSIIAMFSSFCDSCGTTSIISWLDRICKKNKSVQIICLLPAKYGSSDIRALRSQLSLSFPIHICDAVLGQKWEALIERYGEQSLNNILFVFDKTGRILGHYENSQPLAFRALVENLIRETGKET